METTAPAARGVAVSASTEELVRRAAALAARSPRSVLGIVGAPGAGKSTLCAALERALGASAVVVGMDGFHLADPVLEALGRRARKGAPDTFDVDGYVALLDRLRTAPAPGTSPPGAPAADAPATGVVYAPLFDRDLEASFAAAVPVPASVPLVVTEGNYLLHDAHGWERVRSRLDEVWFLDVDPAERVRRLLARRATSGEPGEVSRAWVLGVDEANAALVDAGRERADLVVHLRPPTPPTEETPR